MADRRTRAEMEAAIKGGGSVMLDSGKVVTDISKLPSEADIAKGDVTQEKLTRESLEARKAEIERQLAQLGGVTEAGAKSGESTDADPDELPADLAGRQFLIDDKRFVTRAAIEAATDEELLSVKFVGQKTVEEIRSVIPRKE